MEPEQKVATGNDYTDGDEKEREETGEMDVRGKKEKERSEKELETRIAKENFLEAHKLGMSVVKAALMAGVERRTIYRWRDKDPEFAKAWREAREGLVEDLEMEAYRRAFKGNDRLLVFLLKSYKPVTYNQRQQQAKSSHQQGDSGGGEAKDLAELVERVREWQ